MNEDQAAVYYRQDEFDVVREVLHGSPFEKERKLEAIQCLDRIESRALMALDDLSFITRDNTALRDVVAMYEGDTDWFDEPDGTADIDDDEPLLFIEVDLDDLLGNA